MQMNICWSADVLSIWKLLLHVARNFAEPENDNIPCVLQGFLYRVNIDFFDNLC